MSPQRLKLMKLVRIVFVLCFALIAPCILAQDSQSNYVTIGVFRVLDNAIRYTNAANKSGFTAQYALNPQRKLYYVYLMNNGDLKTTWNFLMKIRTETVYKDAWIFMGSLETEEVVVKTEPKVEPKVEPKIEPVKEPERPPVVETQPAKDTATVVVQKIDSSAIKKAVEPP